MSPSWLGSVHARAKNFASAHKLTYNVSDRQLSASFEIGCFHALLDFYSTVSTVSIRNAPTGEYRYLTTPAGDPNNFSFVELTTAAGNFQIRQQVRVRSHVHDDICFTPDLVVFSSGATIDERKDADYASGKKKFLSISSHEIVAAHECKSLNPFPELVVGFLGMLVAGHPWAQPGRPDLIAADGTHLAPTLFVGGAAQGIHRRMITAVKQSYPVNVVVGMHEGTWDLLGESADVKRMIAPATHRLSVPLQI